MEKRFGSIVTEKVSQYVVRLVAFLAPSFMPRVIIGRTRGIIALHCNPVRPLRQIGNFLINFPILSAPYFRQWIVLVVTAITCLGPSVRIGIPTGVHHYPGHIIGLAIYQRILHTRYPQPVGTGLNAVQFQRIKCPIFISIFQTAQIFLILRESLICIGWFIPCLRKFDRFSCQCVIGFHIGFQRIHAGLQRLDHNPHSLFIDVRVWCRLLYRLEQFVVLGFTGCGIFLLLKVVTVLQFFGLCKDILQDSGHAAFSFPQVFQLEIIDCPPVAIRIGNLESYFDGPIHG